MNSNSFLACEASKKDRSRTCNAIATRQVSLRFIRGGACLLIPWRFFEPEAYVAFLISDTAGRDIGIAPSESRIPGLEVDSFALDACAGQLCASAFGEDKGGCDYHGISDRATLESTRAIGFVGP